MEVSENHDASLFEDETICIQAGGKNTDILTADFKRLSTMELGNFSALSYLGEAL